MSVILSGVYLEGDVVFMVGPARLNIYSIVCPLKELKKGAYWKLSATVGRQ